MLEAMSTEIFIRGNQRLGQKAVTEVLTVRRNNTQESTKDAQPYSLNSKIKCSHLLCTNPSIEVSTNP